MFAGGRWLAVFAVLVGCLLLCAPASAGTWPGSNGRIAYEYLGTIYTIALGDGAGQQLVTHPDGGGEPSWSPRGDRVVFVSERGGEKDLYVIDADGTGERRLTSNDTIDEENPSWVDNDTVIFRADPDGSADPTFSTVNLGAAPTSTYAFYRAEEPEVVDNFTEPEISANGQLMFTDYFQIPGTTSFRSAAWTAFGNGEATNVSGTEEPGWSGGWSPNGVRFVYSRRTPGCCDTDIFVDSAGSAPVDITNTPGRSESDPRFSPDGTMVVYGDPLGADRLYVSAADGSGEITLPTGFSAARRPDWGIVPGTAPSPPEDEPEPTSESTPSAPPSPPPDTTAPRPKTRAKGKPRAGKPLRLVVRLNENGRVIAKGVQKRSGSSKKGAGASSAFAIAARKSKSKLAVRLKPVRRRVRASVQTTLVLKPQGKKNRRAAKRLRRAVKRGASAKAIVHLRFVDQAGNSSKKRLALKLR